MVSRWPVSGHLPPPSWLAREKWSKQMNRRLLRHFTTSVAPISVLLLAVGVWAAWRVQHLQERVSREVRENVSAMRAAEELEILLREFRTRLEHFKLSGEQHHL